MTATSADLDRRVSAGAARSAGPATLGRIRRGLDAGIVISAAVLVAIGLWLSAVQLLVVRSSSSYAHAPACPRLADAAAGADCVAQFQATVVSVGVLAGADTTTQPLLAAIVPALGGARVAMTIPRPTTSYYQLRRGQSVSLKVWKGRVTAVYVTSNDALRTSASPYVEESLELSTGLFSFGMGVVLLLIHPPGRLSRWMSARTRWHQPDDVDSLRLGLVERMRSDRLLGLGFLAFTVMQLLDIVTSIHDSSRGFFEANPLAAALVNAYGPFLGFMGIKVPATIALFLGVARLPRRIALLVIATGVAVMIYIVGQNAALYAFSNGV